MRLSLLTQLTAAACSASLGLALVPPQGWNGGPALGQLNDLINGPSRAAAGASAAAMASAARLVTAGPLPAAPVATPAAVAAAPVAEGTEPVIIVGGGLAGLVAAYELTQAKRKVIIIDQEPEQNLGGQAFWSLGGIFLIDSGEQRLMGIKDNLAMATRDWFNSAGFSSGANDKWGIRWANEYLKYANGPMRSYVTGLGMAFMPNVGWAERGSGNAGGHGNSVPRFHVTWGTGPEVVRVFREPVLRAAQAGLVEFRYRHQVDELVWDASKTKIVGVKGTVLEPSSVKRGEKSSRTAIGQFTINGSAVILSTGGIGGNEELVRKLWPTEEYGTCPKTFVLGVPNHVDGRGLDIARAGGANIVNSGRLWTYTEGLKNFDPIWPNHGIRVIPGPSSLWLDATGKRFPAPIFPGGDTIASLKAILRTGYDYSWFILDQKSISREFALSGSEQNPDFTNKSVLGLVQRLLSGSDNVKAFVQKGEDFVVRGDLRSLVDGMNDLARRSGRGPAAPISYEAVEKIIVERDDQIDNAYSKDAQIMYTNNARQYFIESLSRIAQPHKYLDTAANGPLIAVRMNLITRKTLGGIQTNLKSQVLRSDGETPIAGLYAAGEVAGFGGGGYHGKNSLEGTFLSGCIYSGRAAGRALAGLPA